MFNFNIKLIEDFELEKFYNLLSEFGPPVAGLTNRRIYRAIGREALKNDKIIIVIAKDDKKIIGFAITVIDWKKFWFKFFLSNQIIAFEIIMKRIIEKIKAIKEQKKLIENLNEIKEFISTEQNKKSWSDSSPQIAKIIYTGVSEKYRKKGIGTKLANYRFKILAERGVVRIDSTLDSNNMSAIKLNCKLGYKIYQSGNRLFTSKDLLG